jgi:hypothetical protein
MIILRDDLIVVGSFPAFLRYFLWHLLSTSRLVPILRLTFFQPDERDEISLLG